MNQKKQHGVAIRFGGRVEFNPPKDEDTLLMDVAIEMQIMQTASGHPNVVLFEEAFYSPGQVHPIMQVALVMELCRGSLHD